MSLLTKRDTRDRLLFLFREIFMRNTMMIFSIEFDFMKWVIVVSIILQGVDLSEPILIIRCIVESKIISKPFRNSRCHRRDVSLRIWAMAWSKLTAHLNFYKIQSQTFYRFKGGKISVQNCPMSDISSRSVFPEFLQLSSHDLREIFPEC